jgi:hypothetical protein
MRPTKQPDPRKTLVSARKAKTPQLHFLAAIDRLANRVSDLRPTFDRKGFLRTLTTDSTGGLFPNAGSFVSPEARAHAFLHQPDITTGLELNKIELSDSTLLDLPTLGSRVSYTQQVEFDGKKVPVLHGRVDVYMDKNGTVFNLNSSLRHGEVNEKLTRADLKVRDEKQAIEIAVRHLKYENIEKSSAEFYFGEYRRKLNPLWRVVISTLNPRHVTEVLVKATTGAVVGEPRELIRYEADKIVLTQPLAARRRRRPGATSQIAAKSFLTTPNHSDTLLSQVYDVIFESLPDPKKLANSNYTLYIGNKHDPVQAKADGTFNYLPNKAEFSATVTRFVLNIHIELLKKWGLNANTKTMPTRVEDTTTQDNASFDQYNWEIRIGTGSGSRFGGLERYIAYDISVSLHENGHYVVYLQVPGHDLSGDEGDAIHEAIGDVLGSLLMVWWLKSKYSKQLGITFTVSDIVNDERRVGTYASPPKGIRKQKNTKKPPLVGEPHADAEIVGGAMADLMVELVTANGVEPGLEKFGRLTLAALALLPSHKSTFRDLLNSFLTADKALNASANKQLILDCFSNHGIKLTGGRRRGGSTPIIIIN